MPTVPPTEPAVCAVQPADAKAKAVASTATTTFTARIPLPDLRAFIGFPLRLLITPFSELIAIRMLTPAMHRASRFAVKWTHRNSGPRRNAVALPCAGGLVSALVRLLLHAVVASTRSGV